MKKVERKSTENYVVSLLPRQVVFRKRNITTTLNKESLYIDLALIGCIISEPYSRDYVQYLAYAAIRFEQVSRPVYVSKGKYVKLPRANYSKLLFEYHDETFEDVFENLCQLTPRATLEQAFYCHKVLKKISEIVCPMIACVSEQAFISEYATAIDYVIKHRGDLPKIKMETMFPTNLPDFSYNSGISNLFRQCGVV